jgi:hypothetical protein
VEQVVAKRIEVDPGGEVARLVREADDAQLVVVVDGEEYRIAREDPIGDPDEDEIWEGYDPALVLKGLEAAAGSWSDIDADQLIEDIYRWREEGSRSAERR